MVTAEIKDVKIDEVRGSIIVETEYKINGIFVQLGRTRYLETSGTNQEIIDLVKQDIDDHCANLIRRIEINREFFKVESLKIQKALTQPIIDAIKDDLIGYSMSENEAVSEFKGKEITVTVDGNNSVKDKEV